MNTPSTATDTVRIEVKVMMARHDERQVDIAAVLGLSQSQISERIHGRKAFTIHELELLGAHWDVPITFFFADKAGAVPHLTEAGTVEYPAVTRNLPAIKSLGRFTPGPDDLPGVN
jgi:transcriptional regulator with XRE-family HTH domain